jgi:hypothetical protein
MISAAGAAQPWRRLKRPRLHPHQVASRSQCDSDDQLPALRGVPMAVLIGEAVEGGPLASDLRAVLCHRAEPTRAGVPLRHGFSID